MGQRSLEDELEIRDLIATYALSVGRRDAEAWGETWTEDAEWNVLGRAPKGRAEVIALWNGLMSQFPLIVHSATDGIVCVNGDRATGTWAITEQGYREGGRAVLVLGRYKDEYRRTSEGWRIRKRDFECLYQGAPDFSDL